MDRDLIERLRCEHTVDPPLFEVVGHSGWSNLFDRHVLERIEAVLGQEMAQQVVVHREAVGHAESETRHVSYVGEPEVLFGECESLTVDVLNRCQFDVSAFAVDTEARSKGHG